MSTAGFKGFSQNRQVTARERRNAALLSQAMDRIFSGALNLGGDGLVTIQLASDGGLTDSGDELAVVGHDGVIVTTDGVAVELAAPSGLHFVTGALAVEAHDGLTVTVDGVAVNLATNSGLEFEVGELRVRVNPDGTIIRDADGIGVDFDAAAPTTTTGDLIAYDGTNNVRVAVGTGRQLLVPDTTAPAGVAWENRFSGCQVYIDNAGAGFDVADLTETHIEWDAERFDTDDYHDNTTNNTRLTVPESGRYRLSMTFVWNAAPPTPWPTGGSHRFQFRVNGAASGGSMWIETLYQTSNPARSFSRLLDLEAGDYVEIVVLQVTGATQTLFSDATTCTIERVD